MGRRIVGLAPEALAALQTHAWPGNVRELENVIERAVALESTDRIQLDTLPEEVRAGGTPTAAGPSTSDALPERGFNLERHLEDIERAHLERALRQTGGVQMKAADLLGLSFRQFRYLVKKYAIRI
jgi:two-component system response regulator PilR (NtrC family)